MEDSLLRPLGAAIAVALWNGPLVIGWWVGGNGFRHGMLIGGLFLASWLMAAWFSSAWRARFFTPDAPHRVTDGQILGSAAGVLGLSALGYVLFR